MTRKCVLLDEDNAGKISLEVELVMPIWKFGSCLHLISILPKLLTNYADGGGIWCILIKLEFTCFFIDINFLLKGYLNFVGGIVKKSNMMVMMIMFREKLQAIGIDDKMKNYVGPVRSQLMTRPAVEVLTKILLSLKKWLS